MIKKVSKTFQLKLEPDFLVRKRGRKILKFFWKVIELLRSNSTGNLPKPMARDQRFQALDDVLSLGTDDTIMQRIGKVAGLIVPIEIVFPPLAISQLDVLNGLTR